MRAQTGRRGESRDAAFTLLEVTMAMGLFVILMGGIFLIARQVIFFNSQIRESQDEAMTTSAFLELLRRNFLELPGNAQVLLAFQDSPPLFPSELLIQNAPNSFSWGAVASGAENIVVRSEPTSDRAMRVELVYFNGDYRNKAHHREKERFLGTLPLLRGVETFRWRVLNPRTMEWQEDWEIPQLKPPMVELTMKMLYENRPLRKVFWLPPIANPQRYTGSHRLPPGDSGGERQRDRNGQPPDGPSPPSSVDGRPPDSPR